jgi:hypothetical protein
MTLPWPPPNVKPLNRLQVDDGLLINADRWRLAHEYHRQRQNAHFQSLNQPGIVSDMGVQIVEAPAEVIPKYRDNRWVQIQPGVAIDLFGNLIVIPEPVDFRISSEVVHEEPLMVYLVVSYVDPEQLQRQTTANGNGDVVTETFRIDEKNTPPAPWEVELCRILLEPGEVQLSPPADVFYPRYNNLDLRYRPQARSRPQGLVRLGQITQNSAEDEVDFSHLFYLLQSVEALYPRLQGSEDIGQFSLRSAEELEQLVTYDLVYLKSQPSRSLNPEERAILKQYVERGGVLFVEAEIQGSKVEELISLQYQLIEALNRLANGTTVAKDDPEREEKLANFAEITESLQTELKGVKESLIEQIDELSKEFQTFARELGQPLEDLERLSRTHPLRTQPFLFAALPPVNGQSIKLLAGGGIIVVLGNLSSAWGLDEELSLSRETIRTAQEMGINILNYARSRRQMMQLMQAIPEGVS